MPSEIQGVLGNAGKGRARQNDPFGLDELAVKETEPVRALIHLAGSLKFPGSQNFNPSQPPALSVLLCLGLFICPRAQGRIRDKEEEEEEEIFYLQAQIHESPAGCTRNSPEDQALPFLS